MVSSPDLEGCTNAPKSGNRLTKAEMLYRPMLRFRGCILGPLGPDAEEEGNGGTGQGTPPHVDLADMRLRFPGVGRPRTVFWEGRATHP